MIHKPVVIITDRYTGSAAEHLAAVMQRERRARIVGARPSSGFIDYKEMPAVLAMFEKTRPRLAPGFKWRPPSPMTAVCITVMAAAWPGARLRTQEGRPGSLEA